MQVERVSRWALVAIAVIGLTAGGAASFAGRPELANLCWTFATIPVIAGLAISIVRDLVAGRVGVDAIALISMSAALALGQPLAGAVVALMYAGGNMLEEIAVVRAEGSLRALVDRAPRIAHRRLGERIEDTPVEHVAVGDQLVVKAGEVVPVDGNVASPSATIDKSALTGEPIPVVKAKGGRAFSGTLNAGATFEIAASAVAGDSAYAGIVRLVTAAQTAKAPFTRLADRYALFFLPFTCAVAFVAWLISGDIIRSLAVFVAATPCPLILAAPVALIAGVARSARRGILVKGGGPLEALARAHTVLFDKTGTLTVGGARLLSIEPAPGEDPDEVLKLGASLEQASHHVLASAIVQAAMERGLDLKMPNGVKEDMGAGLQGLVGDRRVGAGSLDMIFAGRQVPEWARRAARRAEWRSALTVFVTIDGRPAGALLLADEVRADTPRAIASLRDAGVRRVMMVTGDRAAAAQAIGAALDLEFGAQRLRPFRQSGSRPDREAIASYDHGWRRHQRRSRPRLSRRWRRHGGARRQRFVGGGGCGDPNRPGRSCGRSHPDRKTRTPDRGPEHRGRNGSFDLGDARGDAGVAYPCSRSDRAGSHRRRRHP